MHNINFDLEFQNLLPEVRVKVESFLFTRTNINERLPLYQKNYFKMNNFFNNYLAIFGNIFKISYKVTKLILQTEYWT